MVKELFQNITSSAVPLRIDNIDTDQIIPARFLKAVSRQDFGRSLFADWRYLPDGNINPKFIINSPIYLGKILIAGRNFGCGSSREHAAWALYDYGFRVIVSSHFENNALNNGILPIQIPDEIILTLFDIVESKPETKFIIDLEKQIFCKEDESIAVHFQINAFKKECLLNGYDSIDYLINMKSQVEKYEKKRVANLI